MARSCVCVPIARRITPGLLLVSHRGILAVQPHVAYARGVRYDLFATTVSASLHEQWQ